jgi:GcrA cell cycle regulator
LNTPPALRIDLLGLQTCMCRWPIGDPRDGNFHFCGHSKTGNSSYCAAHARMAFRPADRRTA